MKITINENKLFNSIYNYIDKKFDKDEIDWAYGLNTNEDSEEYPDDESFLFFFRGDYYGEDDSDIVFYYFDVDYFYDTPGSHREDAPILEVYGDYARDLDSLFGNRWKEPMKKWFEENKNLPVKTVSTYY